MQIFGNANLSIKGAREIEVRDMKDVADLMKQGAGMRVIAATSN